MKTRVLSIIRGSFDLEVLVQFVVMGFVVTTFLYLFVPKASAMAPLETKVCSVSPMLLDCQPVIDMSCLGVNFGSNPSVFDSVNPLCFGMNSLLSSSELGGWRVDSSTEDQN